jgi:hypothetical protein
MVLMLNNIHIFTLTFFVFVGINPRTEAFELSWEMRQLESQFKDELEKSILPILGDKYPFSIQISLRAEEQFQSPAGFKKKGTDLDVKALDLAYMSIPSVEGYNATGKNEDLKTKPDLRFTELLALVFLSDKTPTVLEAQVRKIIDLQFRFYNPKVTIQKMKFDRPERNPASLAQPKESVLPTPAVQPQEVSQKGLSKEPAEQMPLWQQLLLPILGFMGLLAITVLGLVFSNSISIGLNAVSQGLSSLRNIKIEKSSEDDSQLKHLIKDGEVEVEHKGSQQPVGVDLFWNEREKIITQLSVFLKERPELIKKTASNTLDDKRGLRWLLTVVGDTDRELLIHLLAPTYFDSTELSSISDLPVGNWLQSFIERLIITQAESSDLLRQTFSESELNTILSWRKESLKNAVIRVASPGAWRLARELLSKMDFLELSKEITESSLVGLLGSLAAGSSELKEGFVLLCATINQSSSAKLNEETFIFDALTSKLLSGLNSMSFQAEEQYLEKIKQINPQLYNRLRGSYWSLSHFFQLSQTAIEEVLVELDPEAVFALLISLPGIEREGVLKLIPDGNRKVIILDLLRSAHSEIDEKTQHASLRLARRIIENACSKNFGNAKGNPREAV